MGSHRDFLSEWSALNEDIFTWTYDDLKVVALLGKALLERNGQLEEEISEVKGQLDDKIQLNKFLQNQVTSMKEEAEKQVLFYDHLETSISELERNNIHLSQKHDLDKKRIKSLCENIEYLEKKCEEITNALQTLQIERNRNFFMEKINRGAEDLALESDVDSGIGLGRRSKSLQDLSISRSGNSRDYSPSPSEEAELFPYKYHPENHLFYSNFEDENIEISKNGDEGAGNTGAIQDLQSKLFYLTQESNSLYENLKENLAEKESLIANLRNQLNDCTDCNQYSAENKNVSLRERYTPEKEISDQEFPPLQQSGPETSTNSSTNQFCKRCSNEVNLLKLLNTIEGDETDLDGEEEGEGEGAKSLEEELSASIDQERQKSPKYLPNIKLMPFQSVEFEEKRSPVKSYPNHMKKSNREDYVPEKWYFEEKETQKESSLSIVIWWILWTVFICLSVIHYVWSLLQIFFFLSSSRMVPLSSTQLPSKLEHSRDNYKALR